MKLYANCSNCKEELSVKSHASTRTDLEREKGEVVDLKCPSCGEKQEKHVNDIKAKHSNTILFGGLAISILTTLFLWNVAGVIGGISLVIPLIIWKQQQRSTHAFNAYLRRR